MDAPISSPTMAHRQLPSSSTASSTSQSSYAPPAPAAQKAPSTDAFIRDLNLVAEAAKRAQMAVLMRDLDNIALPNQPDSSFVRASVASARPAA
ncbi:hypothetical protein F4821DRAFT_256477 [Hypoxylon rubiginosum]|uniref:Uncharacterized protein n=1 Tax=Hypoxylon rubiginosum TaxID=110542 RepID=A0ACC0DBC0_9PEZI|nr:hypothetical protein F4821DRAFT_256477 [Hypoxylon rubiginosum]